MAKGAGQGSPLWTQWALFLGIVAAPGSLVSVTAVASFERAKSVQFCSSCHVMGPFVSDLKDPKSEGLAAKHYQNRWINQDQCYTCHTNYDFLGPVDAKWRGFRHTVAYYSGSKRPPKLYSPFSNAQCLHCHEGAKSFMAQAAHEPVMADIRSGEMSCLSCHGAAHTVAGAAP